VIGYKKLKGADVEAKDNNGGTALFWAAEGGYEAVVRHSSQSKLLGKCLRPIYPSSPPTTIVSIFRFISDLSLSRL
jgi:hypothetical protein